MKQSLLNTKGLVRLGTALFLFLIISANSLFAAGVSWVGTAGDNNWATPSNWAGGILPTSSDDVTIGGGYNVNILVGSSFTINSLQIYGNDATHKLSIAGTLTVTNTGGTSDAVQIGGGIIENSGTFTVTSSGDKSGINLKNGGAPVSSSILTNIAGGTLAVNTVSTNAGSGNGVCIVFSQNNGSSPIFNTAGSINLKPSAGLKHYALSAGGGTNAQLLGTGFALATGDYGLLTSGATSFTIGQSGGTNPVISFIAASPLSANLDAVIYLGGYDAASSFINYGSLTITGVANQAIKTYQNVSGTPIPAQLTLSNNGPLSLNGNFSGGAFIIGAANGCNISITNNDVMSITTSAGDASQFGKTTTLTNNGTLNFAGGTGGVSVNDYSNGLTVVNNASKTINITNGNLNIGGINSTITNSGSFNFTPTSGFSIGKTGSNFTNTSTGTLTVNAGIQSNGGTPTFTNNGNVVLNTGTNTGINANVTFTNNGTIKGAGAITPASITFNASASIVSPGNSSVSKIILAGAANTINGKYLADINGVTTAGTDYDQLDATTAAANVDVTNLTIATTFGAFTKTTGDAIVLINTNAGSITGTPTFTPALPSGWVLTTTGGQVKITYNAALPITLVSFKGTTDANSNLLTWITASEYNNYGFEVQRKTSNDTWEVIGFVKGENKPSTYKFKDGNPVGTSYYRLRQLDNDKTESFSNIVVVKQALSANISLSPNPTSDYLNINVPTDGVSSTSSLVNVFDLAGKKVLSQSYLPSNFKIDLTNLKSGAYFISIENGGNTLTQKIIKQ